MFVAELATNNVPKWWLAQFGLTNFNADATNDIDRDGFYTWQEWVAVTDPTNDQSFFRFEQIGDFVPGGLVIHWPSASNRFYSLLRSTNLFQGSHGYVVVPGAGNLPGMPQECSFTVTVDDVDANFYDVEVRE